MSTAALLIADAFDAEAAQESVAASWAGVGAAVSSESRPAATLCAFAAEEAVCPKCGPREFVDVPIHGGRSTRRDCACGRTLGFPRWYAREGEGAEPAT